MDSELRTMVMAFRVTELQTFLAYAGKNKTGRKNELQARALELIKNKPTHVVSKIRELYRSIQLTTLSTLNQQTASSVYQQNTLLSSGFVSNGVYNSNNSNSGYAGAADKVLTGRNPFNCSSLKIPGISSISMPICPDIKLKRLPFYDILSELIKPTSLIPHGNTRIQEANFSFCLTPNQAADVASSKEFTLINYEQKIQYAVQIQLRFCLMENKVDQDDLFPPSIVVKVNGKLIPLPNVIPSNRPGVEPKRPSRPLNVTNFVKLSPTCTNTVSVTWAAESSKGYALSLFLVRKLSSSDLLKRIKAKGIKPPDYTIGMIKEIVSKDDDDCIATASLTVSIACPLGKNRMSLPCRAINTCMHLQCFDANLYLQMNEKKPTWNCPVCDKTLLFDNLAIDGYFHEVINKVTTKDTGGTSNDIEIYPDGSWVSQMSKVKNESDGPPAKKSKTESNNKTICLDDEVLSDDDEPKKSTISKKKANESEADFVDLTVSDSDEDEENIRPAKRSKTNIINDDDSSNSSTATAPEIRAIPLPKAPQQQQQQQAPPASSSSPPIITLDDDSDSSPSPEPPSNRANGNASASTRSSSTTSNCDSQSQNFRSTPPFPTAGASTNSMPALLPLPVSSSSSNQFSYSTSMNSNWAPYGTRTAQSSTNPVPVTRSAARFPSQLPTQPQQPQLQQIVPNPLANTTNPYAYSSTYNPWDSNYASANSDFGSLDFNDILNNTFGTNPNTGPRYNW